MKKILNFIKNLYKKNVNNVIGIDLGTANTLICLKGKGIVLNEASTIAFMSEDGENSGYLYGNKAKDLIGKTPFRIEVVNPIEDGVICRSALSESMVRNFISTTIGENMLFLPTVIAGVPFSATDVEKKALEEVIERCNAKEVFLIYESIASAIGAGLPVDKAVGSLIIDIGGGTTEISVISLGGIIKNKTFKYGGRKIDQSIVEYMEKKHNLLIGINTAEEIKKQLAVAYLKPDDDVKKMMVYGRNLALNVPQEIVIDQNEIVVSCSEFINTLIENLNYLLEMTPPELMKDIVKNGITVCGGGAKIANLDYVIQEITGINVTIPAEPELCLIKGLEKIVDDYKSYEHLLFKQL